MRVHPEIVFRQDEMLRVQTLCLLSLAKRLGAETPDFELGELDPLWMNDVETCNMLDAEAHRLKRPVWRLINELT